MGIGYTIDTPIRVAPYGVDSVISLVDDSLIERLRKMYCERFGLPYKEITVKSADYRANRITEYLNLIGTLANRKLEEIKNSTQDKQEELKAYFHMLPGQSPLRQEFVEKTRKYFHVEELRSWLKENMTLGSIDVNIMTKVDRDNYANGKKLDNMFNDGHAALRGFANSDLHSSVILSAGMNPRLYAYMENFEGFYPNEQGIIKKKIVLKVSDFRSALIQGKFLAKKGLWISEFRIESGLNCGGHAFATDGFLIGPILAEFRDKMDDLKSTLHPMLVDALKKKDRIAPTEALPIKITAQGGVGTSEEHEFLLKHYKVDSVGWGSPFLLVPEVCNVDEDTIQKLCEAKEVDLYLSDISPWGVPFNSLKGNSKDEEKHSLIREGRPGSACPKQYVALNTEFTEKGICSASRNFQSKKIKALQESNLSPAEYEKQYKAVVAKSCICVGLGTSALLVNNLDTRIEGVGVSVCPGPNMAYFSKKMSFREMVDHIYGRANVIERKDRPNMFMKELSLYMNYLQDKVKKARKDENLEQNSYLLVFTSNMLDGINYYVELFKSRMHEFASELESNLAYLAGCKAQLISYQSEIAPQKG